MKMKSVMRKDIFFRCLNIAMLIMTVILTAVAFFESIFVIRTGVFLKPVPVIFSSVALGILLLFLYRFFVKIEDRITRLEKPAVFLLAAVYFLALVWFGKRLTVLPEYDLNSVQRAAALLAMGEKNDAWEVYFRNFTNQIPVTLLLALCYRIGFILGMTDTYAIGNAFNAGAIALTVLTGYFFARKFFRPAAALTVLLTLICNPIWALYVSWTSTDTFCLPFLMSGLLLLGDSLNGKLRLWKIWTGMLFLCMAFTIRATTIVLIAAYLIYFSSKHKFSEIVKILLVVVTAFLLCNTVYHKIADHFDAPYHTDDRMPVSHWLMLGSNEASWGEFSYEDYDRSMGLSTYAERDATSRAVFISRIKEMFPVRLVFHGMRKMAETWSSGYCVETTWRSVRAPGTVYEYTIGDKSAAVQYLCQSFRVVLFFSLLCLSAYRLLKKNKEISFLLTAWLGALAFYLLWEAGQRYALSFIPWLSIAAGEVLELYGKRGRAAETGSERGNERNGIQSDEKALTACMKFAIMRRINVFQM